MKNKLNKLKKLNKPFKIAITLLVITLAIFLMTLSNVYQESYELERYSTANETILSPISIEDTRETERRQRDVLQAVEDRYLISSDVTEERMDYVEELFAVLETVNHPDPTPDQSDDEETEEDQKEQEEEESLAEKSSTDKLQEFKQIVSQEITDHIDDEELLTLITAS